MASRQNLYTKAYLQNEDALDAAQARLDKIANDALGPPSTSYSPKRELEYHPMNLFRKWSAEREFSNLLDEKNRLLSGNVHGPMFEDYWKTITQNPDAYGYRTDQDVSGLGESRLRNLPEAVSEYPLSDDRLNQLWHERAYTGAALPNVVPGIDPTIPTDVDSPWYMPTGMDLWDAILLAGGLGRKKVLPFLAKKPLPLLPFVASGHNEGREVDPETGRYVNTYPWDD